jgi:hypothetical protein
MQSVDALERVSTHGPTTLGISRSGLLISDPSSEHLSGQVKFYEKSSKVECKGLTSLIVEEDQHIHGI